MTDKHEDREMGEPEDEGLMSKLRRKKREETKEYKQLTRGQFRSIIFGYFAEGFLRRPRAVWKKVRHEYRVDGHKIVLGDILGLKQRYIDEYGEKEVERPVAPKTPPTGEQKDLLMKLYEDTKGKDDPDSKKLVRRIQNKLLGEDDEEKPMEKRLAEAYLKQREGGGEGGGGNAAIQQQMQDASLSMMKYQTQWMNEMAERSKKTGLGLSGDPSVALAQVVVPAAQDGFSEVNETLREIGGLEPREKKLKPGQQKKVDDAKQIIEQFQKLDAMYCQCAECGFVIPKKVAQCPRCEAIFKPSPEEVADAKKRQEEAGKPFIEPLTPEELERRMLKKKHLKRKHFLHAVKRLPYAGANMSKNRFPEELEWLEEYFKPDGYLERLRNKIRNGHDAKRTMRGIWSLADPEEEQDKKLLFVATKGMDYILEAGRPYVDGYNQKEVFEFFSTPDAKIWLGVGLGEIRRLAKEDSVELTADDITRFEKSTRKFIEVPEAKEKSHEEKKEEPQAPGPVECAICRQPIPADKISEHSEKCASEQLKKFEAEERAKAEKEKTEKAEGDEKEDV